MKTTFIALCALLFTSCSSTSPQLMSFKEPVFNLESYFEGKTTAWGIVLNRNGSPIKQFVVDLEGTVSNNVLTLHESFTYNDGKKEIRDWTITKLPDNTYVGKAADVVGEAKGVVSGNALNWSYVLRVPYDGDTIDLTFDDWMFLQDDKTTLINKAKMSKFGFHVGEILIFFKK